MTKKEYRLKWWFIFDTETNLNKRFLRLQTLENKAKSEADNDSGEDDWDPEH